MAILAPFLHLEPLVDEKRMLSRPWHDWLLEVSRVINRLIYRMVRTTLTAQQASIAATDLTDTPAAAGLYRVTYYARITQPATTSSSLIVTLGWTEGGVSLSYSGAAMTGNTTATVQSGTQMIRVDARSAINGSTTYASVGATPMQYRLDVTIEKVDA